MSILKSAARSRTLRFTAAISIAGAALVGLTGQSAQAAAQALKLSSATGPASNATTVLQVTGKSFIDATGTVDVGDVEFQNATCGTRNANSAADATSKAIVSDTRIVLTTPSLALAASTSKTDYYLCVYNAANTTLVGSAKYTVYAAPHITAAISPTSGSAQGGGTVTVTGTGFTSKSTVKFGTVASPKVTVNTAGTKISAVVPAQAVTGAVSLVVSTEGGNNVVDNAGDDQFTYQNAITVSPHVAKLSTTTTISVTGVGFSSLNAFGTGAGKSAVAFVPTTWAKATHGTGGTSAAAVCSNYQLVSDTEIVCDAPSTATPGSFFVQVVKDVDAAAATPGASVPSTSSVFTFAAF